MARVRKNFFSLLMIASILAFTPFSTTHAATWEDGFPVQIAYQELDGADSGSVDITLTMVIPSGTPLLARNTALDSTLSALHDIWNIESVHDEVRDFLGPVVPLDVQNAISHISGSSFVLELMDAFDAVTNTGFSRFQDNTTVSAVERIFVPRRSMGDLEYPDTPRFFAWVIGEGWPEIGSGHENWVIASLINYSASVLSFRSEVGRFPSSLAELRETDHLLIHPLNPYSGEQVREVNSVSPGDISYQYVDNSRVVLMTYVHVGTQTDVIRREINVPASGYDYLYRVSAGLSNTDREIARYVFQIAQILNEYYFQYSDLPYSVPQCESDGFAYVSFRNPYSSLDAQQNDSLSLQPGDYNYYRISQTEYFLVGFGESGAKIIDISKTFPSIGLSAGTLRTQ